MGVKKKYTPSPIEKFREQLHKVLEPAARGNMLSKIFDIFIVSLICANVLAIILESLPELTSWVFFFKWFEIISVVIFTAEYILRVWACTTDKRYGKHGPVLGRLKFIVSFMGLVDLFAILPFYLPFVFPIDLRMIRLLRIIRMFRIFKAGRYSDALKSLGRVLKAKLAELTMTLTVTAILLVISASIMYYVENAAQPDVFRSIPHALWWSVVTLTTVGYGDIYPVTVLGKILATVIAILGVGLFALPAGILGSGFVEDFRRRKQKTQPKLKATRETADLYRMILPKRFIGKKFDEVVKELRTQGLVVVGMKRGKKSEIAPYDWVVRAEDEVFVIFQKEVRFED